jgi:hypothetical protein
VVSQGRGATLAFFIGKALIKNNFDFSSLTTMKIDFSNSEKRQYQRRPVSFVKKKWREPQFIDLWTGLTGLRTSMDSSTYFHSLW